MSEAAKLTDTDKQTYDFMGEAVSISGNTVVTGAGARSASGNYYIYVKGSSGWTSMTQTAELFPTGAYTGFGVSVAIEVRHDYSSGRWN